ncbi:hypothetical protein LPB19_16125 [Marinobacter salinisoli]|uniref:Uncharacterized protein n=1 Tax=Marinobacter salinisoli TaxID=2769486 RepID=A0ABX7MUA7_9GAMM|nr:hypothetical protein [Marinobacter salinisoli]QSP94676.1 hypothetical protein LPB19_16125 [Marinobacter salinisoli]
METDSLLSLFEGNHTALIIAAIALLTGLVALVMAITLSRSANREVESLRQQARTLGRELEELRVGHFSGSSHRPPPTLGADPGAARYDTEKEAYSKIWPQIWHLHDRLGIFIRAIENGESAGDLRLDARNAALEARQLLNQNRPFCNETVEELVSRLIDTEIKVHLTACQHMDVSKEVSDSSSDHERRVLKDKCQALYDGEARDLMNRLVDAIRTRVINVNYP